MKHITEEIISNPYFKYVKDIINPFNWNVEVCNDDDERILVAMPRFIIFKRNHETNGYSITFKTDYHTKLPSKSDIKFHIKISNDKRIYDRDLSSTTKCYDEMGYHIIESIINLTPVIKSLEDMFIDEYDITISTALKEVFGSDSVRFDISDMYDNNQHDIKLLGYQIIDDK